MGAGVERNAAAEYLESCMQPSFSVLPQLLPVNSHHHPLSNIAKSVHNLFREIEPLSFLHEYQFYYYYLC